MQYRVYVSLAGDDRISIYVLDPDTGKLTLQGDVAAPRGPAPLALDPTRCFMYAGLRASREMASFAVDPASGDLSLIGTVGLRSDPCYIATDQSGRFLFSAYYGAGMVAVHRIGTDGGVREPALQWVETAPHAHCIQTDPSNRFVYVPHTVPSNLILQFAFDQATGTLTPLAMPRACAEAGVGPRHYCFHPTSDSVYFSNEQGCSVSAYRRDSSAGILTRVQTVSTLPAGYEGENTCAQIHIHPTGRFLYVSNRGHDSIAGFAIDEVTGQLTPLGQQRTEPRPRAFNTDPSGHTLFAAGQGSNRLAAYRIDERSGMLAPLETYAVGENPMWVLMLELSGRSRG